MGDSLKEAEAAVATPDLPSQTPGSIGSWAAVEYTDERPIGCQLDPAKSMFRVFRSKGKALSSGGFGVFITEDSVLQDENEDKARMEAEDASTKNDASSASDSKTTTMNTEQHQSAPSEHLFAEEVLFLHERGLLQALSNEGAQLDSSQLFQLLPKLGVSLPIYLVYAHLRSQDFRVLRHNPKRLEILHEQHALERRQQEGQKSQKNFNHIRRRIRDTVRTAAAPSIPHCHTSHSSNTASSNDAAIQICWDAYNPSSHFGKTHPGLPAFVVAATYFNVPMVRFSDLQSLLQGPCQGIPLKVATVSDSGTVVMFGVTGSGVPSIRQRSNENGGDENDDNENDESSEAV